MPQRNAEAASAPHLSVAGRPYTLNSREERAPGLSQISFLPLCYFGKQPIRICKRCNSVHTGKITSSLSSLKIYFVLLLF